MFSNMVYTYIGDIGRWREWKLGSVDDKGDGGHVLDIVAVHHKLKKNK